MRTVLTGEATRGGVDAEYESPSAFGSALTKPTQEGDPSVEGHVIDLLGLSLEAESLTVLTALQEEEAARVTAAFDVARQAGRLVLAV